MLGGRYRIVAMLGKGGMGEVYRADDLILEQPVALKFLPPELARNEESVARFRNEVRVARQVSHRNVCRVYDLGEAEGLYFLSMEYVDGEDLGSLLRRIGRLPSDKALEIARKLCAGLAAAHEKGVLHRDLKPGNVMLDSQGQVVLTDFGLAALAGDITGADVRSGTPAYMAPEQLAGEEVTVRSDIYSLGLVLYELFTGKLPFESSTLAGLIEAQRHSEPVSPSTLVRDLDPLVERVILRCMNPRPSLRPSSALAVAAALPGADPLAAALAAGETPSPEMVAAAGEGEGLSQRAALVFLVCILAGIAATAVFLVRNSALEILRPEYPPEVLAQKARDLVGRLGYPAVRADEAYGLEWNQAAANYAKDHSPHGRIDWNRLFAENPSVLHFWYRRAASAMTGLMIHDDLMTPGLVFTYDPPLTESGMILVRLDHRGNLLTFDAIPDQKQSPGGNPASAADWSALFGSAALHLADLHPAEPVWTALATSDTRAAWTRETPTPLRVEAAALRGRPNFFAMIFPWTRPDRQAEAVTGQATAVFAILSLLIVVLCTGAAVLAHRNFVQGRGDRRGALRLGLFFMCVQMGLWMARAHFTLSFGTFGIFLVALCTSVFYGAVIWTVYIALEPYARRRWPRSLISWSSLLIGNYRDPIVGRDVLIGVSLALVLNVLEGFVNEWMRRTGAWTPNYGDANRLLGIRSTVAVCLTALPHAIREGLFFFFLILLLRIVLRSEWLAGGAFALIFAGLNAASPDHAVINAAMNFVAMSGLAVVLLRWGLLPMTVGVLVSGIISNAPLTGDTNAWYFGNGVVLIAAVAAFALWAFRVATVGRASARGRL
jgi:tRNA A-37 threonylcarbamoyl transferase component Bud32